MRRFTLVSLVVLSISLFVFACDEGADNLLDGDEPDGDNSDGDDPDGDSPNPDGDWPVIVDGDSPDGDAPDGDSPDGDTPDGDSPDGDTPDGDTPDGDSPDGDSPDGDSPDGDTPDGDSPDGDAPDGDSPDGDTPDGDEPGDCDMNGFTAVSESAEMGGSGDETYWVYNGFNGDTLPVDIISYELYPSFGAPTTPGTYNVTSVEADYKQCGFCLLLYSKCNDNGQGGLSCEKTFMPKPGGTFTLTDLSNAVGQPFAGGVNNIELQEVTIAQDYTTTPVANGDTWCLSNFSFDTTLSEPGYVHMDPPEDLTCDYPDAPYYFLGPFPDGSGAEAGTVPPMEWAGAYDGDNETGLSLGDMYCDAEKPDTLFIIVAAGWCSSCSSFMDDSFCNAGGLHDQLKALNAEVLFVVGDGNTPGAAASNAFANTYVNSHGCSGGYRISDIDNSAGKRVIWGSQMFETIPWAAAIRTSDMKLIAAAKDDGYLIPFVDIAQQNNQAGR